MTLVANRTGKRRGKGARASATVEGPPEYLTAAEMAALMRVSLETVYIWCRSGDVPARQIAGTWRIKRKGLEDMFVV